MLLSTEDLGCQRGYAESPLPRGCLERNPAVAAGARPLGAPIICRVKNWELVVPSPGPQLWRARRLGGSLTEGQRVQAAAGLRKPQPGSGLVSQLPTGPRRGWAFPWHVEWPVWSRSRAAVCPGDRGGLWAGLGARGEGDDSGREGGRARPVFSAVWTLSQGQWGAGKGFKLGGT